MTRGEAVSRGLSWYFNGEPCSRGHMAFRHVGGACRDCTGVKKHGLNPPRMRPRVDSRYGESDTLPQAMVDAGAKALLAADLKGADLGTTAREVYLAMERARVA